MYIKEDLIYEKHEGILVGFVNLGSVNDHLLAFEHSLSLATTLKLWESSTLFAKALWEAIVDCL